MDDPVGLGPKTSSVGLPLMVPRPAADDGGDGGAANLDAGDVGMVGSVAV